MDPVRDTLRALAAGTRVATPVAVVMAHPDDETIGLGPLLGRFDDLVLIHVTDGAPPGGGDATRHGFGDVAGYAEARRRELAHALAHAGAHPRRRPVPGLPVADQLASFAIGAIAIALRDALADRAVVFTHAHEGGHPDHDAVALALRLARPGVGTVIECAGYHAKPGDALAVGCFADDDAAPVTTVALDAEQRRCFGAMLDAFATQSATLAPFRAIDAIRLRRRPAVDPTVPLPWGARYDRFDWGINSAAWRVLARKALGAVTLPC